MGAPGSGVPRENLVLSTIAKNFRSKKISSIVVRRVLRNDQPAARKGGSRCVWKVMFCSVFFVLLLCSYALKSTYMSLGWYKRGSEHSAVSSVFSNTLGCHNEHFQKLKSKLCKFQRMFPLFMMYMSCKTINRFIIEPLWYSSTCLRASSNDYS